MTETQRLRAAFAEGVQMARRDAVGVTVFDHDLIQWLWENSDTHRSALLSKPQAAPEQELEALKIRILETCPSVLIDQLLSPEDGRGQAKAASERDFELEGLRLQLRIYENDQHVNQPLVDDIERFRLEGEKAVREARGLSAKVNSLLRKSIPPVVPAPPEERPAISCRACGAISWPEPTRCSGCGAPRP